MKTCVKCKVSKEYSNFSKGNIKDGYCSYCKTCQHEYYLYRKSLLPPKPIKERIDPKRKRKEYQQINAEKIKIRKKQYQKENSFRFAAASAKRHALKIKATPGWANMSIVKIYYQKALEWTKLTGRKFEVDHIVPLNSEIVCGLHWEGNLQILCSEENRSKSNRYWPDMP